ncbi:MAG: hypothetical protein ACKOZU_00945 [Planctomycetaceae bacterium]
MKPLADILWTLVRWALPLTAAGLIAAVAIGSTRVGEEVRRRVEARLRAELPGLAVQVQAAGLVEGQGIVVRGVTLSDPTLPTRQRQIVRVEEVHLECRTTLAELATGAPRITAVRLRRPVVHAVRAPGDGPWSVARLLDRRSGRATVPVTVEDATLVVEDPARRQWITVRQIGLDVAPGPDGLAVRGSASSDLFERATFAGTLRSGDGRFDVGGTVESIDLSPRAQAILPAGVAGDWCGGLRGRLGLEWRAAGALDDPGAAVFAVTARLEAGRFEHAALPFAVSDVAATFRADRGGVTCERLEGRSGTTLVRGSGRLAGWRPDADFDLLVEAERLVVGRHWEGLLPAALAAQWSKLMPAGEIDVRAQLARRAGAVAPDVSVRCRNVSLTHYRFPYRLDRTVGTVTFKGAALQIHLTGEAGGHPVHVAGTLDTATAGGRGFVEVSGDGMRIDDALLAAMPARSADILRKLRASGSFDFVFRHDRSPQFPRGHANSLGIRLAQCSLAYAGFPYPLTNVGGTIRMDRGRWTIGELVGSNDTGVVRCSGVMEPLGDDDGELVLRLAGAGVVLERELRDALPAGVRRAWDDMDPRGSADFTATVRHRVRSHETTVELEAAPQGDTVSIEPAWFPYRLERLRGRLAWRDGRLLFEDVRGEHGRTTVAAAGSCRFGADGGWHVSFARLAADRFHVDHQLLEALPAGLAQAVAGVRLRGLLSLEGTIDVHSTAAVAAVGAAAAVPGAPAATWDVVLDMEQADLDVGVPVEHVHGGLRLRGASDGRSWSSTGDVAVDSAMVGGVQLTAVEGPLALDAAGVRFGQPAGGPNAAGRRFSARLAGGRLLADGSVEAGDAGRFTIVASLGDADLARLATDATGAAHRYAGRLQGGLEVTGSRAGTHSLAGRGQVRLRDADIYELPLVVALLKILRVRAPDRNAFSSSVVDFRIEGPRAYLDSIELSGDAISLVGAGEVDVDTNLSLTFRSIMGEAETQLPVLKRVMGGASGQFLLVHVDGTLAEPVTSTEAFPTLAAALQQFQTRRSDGPAARTAGGRPAPR